MAKLPKAPIGENPADGGAPDQGDEGPLSQALTGCVLVLLSEPNGEAVTTLGPVFSLSLSSRLGPLPSFRSVFRRSRDEGGEEMLDSSLENLLLLFGEAKEFCKRSPPDSRRRAPGRVDGELLIAFCVCVMEVRRLTLPLFGVPSLLLFCVGGFRGELTDVDKA